MERLPQGVYTAEFRAEAVKLVLAQKMSVAGAAKRLSVPKRSLNNWVVAARAGQLADVGKDRHRGGIGPVAQRTD
jgi:transposase